MKQKILLTIAITSCLLNQACKHKKLTEVVVPLPETTVQTAASENPTDVVTNKGAYNIDKLTIKYDALEPEIAASTLKIHYAKIFVDYTNNINKITEQFKIEHKPIEEINRIMDVSNVDLCKNAGGYYNHKLFFEQFSKQKTILLDGDFKNAIITDFESFANFKNQFIASANSNIGSGWTWLIYGKDAKLHIVSTINENNPLMQNASIKGTPLLCIDLWEHAFLSQNHTNRAQYIEKVFGSINWNVVMRRYQIQNKKTSIPSPVKIEVL